MKKTLSMLLSVLLVISSFIGVFTVTTVSAEETTEETATELVSNGNFENSSLNPFDTNMGAFQNQWATADKIQQSLTSLSKGQWLRATGGAGYDPLDLLSYTDTTNGEGVVEETYVAATATDYAQYFSPCNRVIAQPDDNNDNKNHIARVNQTLFQAINIQNGQYVFKFKVRTNGAQNYLYVNLQGLQKGTESDTTYPNKFADSAYDKFNFKILKVASGNYSVIENKKSESINCAKIILDKPTEWTEVAFIAEVTKNANPTATKNTYAIVDTDEIDFTMLNFFYDSSQVNNNEIGKKYRKQGMYLDDISVKAYTNPFSDAMFYNKDGEVLDNTNEYVAIETTVNGDEVLGLSVGDKVTATLDYNTDCNVFAGWYKNGVRFQREESLTFTVNSTDKYYPKFINKNLLTSSAASYENYAADKILVVTDRTKYPEVGEWGSTFAAGYYGKTYNEVIYDTDHKSYKQTDTGSVRSDVRNTVVDATKAYKGSKSLRLENNYVTFATGLGVKKNTNYTLTYYVTSTVSTTVKTGVLTTLNTANDVVPTPLDGGTAFMQYATGNLPAGATMVRSDVAVNSTEWKKITLDFNSGDFEKLYFVVAPSSNEGYWIDELSLVENASETVDVQFMNTKGEDITAECANEAKPAITNSANPGYLVANADYDDNAFDFKGWYNGDTLLSTDKSFEFANGAYSTLTAKVVSRNLLSSTASFEGYDAETQLKHTGTDYPSGAYFGGNKNAGYLGATYQETIYDNKGTPIYQQAGGTADSNAVSAVVTDDKAYSGKNSVYLQNNFWTASLGIDVKPNTDYVLSYYVLAPKYLADKTVNTIEKSAISTTVNTGGNSNAVAPANMALNSANNLYLDSKTLTDVHDGKNWIKVTHSFNSMNLTKVYLVISQTAIGTAATSTAYIDDMTMIKCDPATLTIDYMKSCASIDPVGCDFDNLFVDQNVQFKVIHNQANAPVVKANNTVITADSNGIYSFKAMENNTLSVRFDGDETLNDHDKGYNGEILSKYDKDVYLKSIWEGNTVYQEPALFVGETETKQLLYPVDKIVSLRSYDLKTNYVEGVDYKVTEDGKIQRLAGSRIPLYTAPLTTTTKPTQNIFPLKDNENEYLCFIGDTVFPQYAVSVTYEHSTTFDDGYTPAAPASQTEKLQKTIEKLKNGEKVNIVIYGDSISTGRSSSGQNSTKDIYTANNKEGEFANLVINVAPYAPTWIQMFETELKNRYPKANINIKNLALGGTTSDWGAKNIADRLALWKDGEGNTITPDLMLIGFGVNDSAGNVTKAAYKTNIQNIINTARSGNTNMEVLLYSPMLPNQRATTWDKEILIGYENALEEIANADSNVGLLKLTSIFTEIIKSKDCVDYLNTNVNHGNDFTARIYATGLLTAMSGESITEYLGTAIRAANGDKKQALRYKFSVSKDLIENGLGGDTLVEYGSIAIPSSYLEGAELIKDGKYKNSNNKTVTPVTGIAYSTIKTPNVDHIIYRETQTAYEFTAALYNIGYNKTTGATNYNAWGYDYSVRNYAIFEDANGNTNTVYDATIAVSSVFKVMNQIEYLYGQYKLGNYTPSSDSDRLKLENDYKTVQRILGDANSEQSKAYQAWSKANVDDIPACTVTADTTDGDAGYVAKVSRSYVAVPYTGNEFIGWYKADKTTQISTDTSLTIADINKNHGGTVVAKFRDKNLLSDIAGAEKLTNDNFKMYNHAEAGTFPVPPTGNYFYNGHATAKWQSASITTNTNYVHSGSNAIKIDARTQDTTCIVMRNLAPNTKYRMSFWWKINQPDGVFKTLLVAPKSVTKRQEIDKNNRLGGIIDGIVTKTPNSDWTYTDFEFTTGAEDTSVKLFYYYDISNGQVPTDTYLYMDELTLNEVAKLYSVTAKAENGVAYKSQLTDSVEGGTSVTLVCSPDNQDAIFNGWYNGETKVSDSQTFTVENVNQNYNLTAKFTKGTEYADTKSGAEITTALQKEGYYDTLFERAIKNKGNQALIANMLKKAQQGDDITIVGLGGSITQGAGSTNPATNSYGKLVANWLQQTFTDNNYNSTVTYKNAGIGATTSDLGLARMQAQVLNHNPDLVIVDFTTNDQNEERYRYTYEALIRKLMEEKVATIAIMFGPVVPENYSADKTCIKRDNRTNLHFPSLLYYDIPVIDYYGTMWDYLDSNGDGVSDSDDLAQWTELWNDYIHPNDAGHKLSANAINYYLNTVLENIDSIPTVLPVVPQKLFYANTAAYIGSTMYDNSNIGGKLTSSSNVTIADYGNVDANTQSQWKTWKISEGGYIEFTLPSCKSFTILRVQQPNGGKAKITFTDSQTTTWTDNSYQSSGQLNWSSATYYGDGETPTTIRIECIDDGDNAKDTFYQISCVFIAE